MRLSRNRTFRPNGVLTPLGQYYQPPKGPVDPTFDLALTTAGQLLSKDDPGAMESVSYVRRIAGAPKYFDTGSSKPRVTKLSDLNPSLSIVANVFENPLGQFLIAYPAVSILTILAAFVGIGYVAGKRNAEPAKQ